MTSEREETPPAPRVHHRGIYGQSYRNEAVEPSPVAGEPDSRCRPRKTVNLFSYLHADTLANDVRTVLGEG